MAGNYISGKKKARSGSAPDPMVQDTPEIVGIVKSHLEKGEVPEGWKQEEGYFLPEEKN